MKHPEKYTVVFPPEPPRDTPMPQVGPDGARPDHMITGIWASHDPAIFRDPETGLYYTYCSSSTMRRSPDLIHWTSIGNCFPDGIPREAIQWTGGDRVWAPDMIKVGNEYRLYCSCSTWGVRGSCIFLAVGESPEGPFTFRDFLLKTTEPESPVNAIDPCPVVEEDTGEHYLVYGSFWGGIRLVRLDRETGLLAPGQGLGTPLAIRPQWAGRAIEGPYIKYNERTGYYYLFTSYASLKMDYNIRVGRSQKITGPYYDYNGRDLRDEYEQDAGVGTMIAAGYRFDGSQGWMGPGHNSVLHDEDGSWYVVEHIRPYDFRRPVCSTMHIHKVLWTSDGWPVMSPCRYAGEREQKVTREDLLGDYERIRFQPMLPQGVLNSVPMELRPDGSIRMGNLRGCWELFGDNLLRMTVGPHREEHRVIPGWDWENWEPTLGITGIDDQGVCVWMKKIDYTNDYMRY